VDVIEDPKEIVNLPKALLVNEIVKLAVTFDDAGLFLMEEYAVYPVKSNGVFEVVSKSNVWVKSVPELIMILLT
jgi:hypothetical protein